MSISKISLTCGNDIVCKSLCSLFLKQVKPINILAGANNVSQENLEMANFLKFNAFNDLTPQITVVDVLKTTAIGFNKVYQ